MGRGSSSLNFKAYPPRRAGSLKGEGKRYVLKGQRSIARGETPGIRILVLFSKP